MSGASSDIFEPTNLAMRRLEESLIARYERLRSNPKYWASSARTKRMSRAISSDIEVIPGIARNFYETSVGDIFLLGGQSVDPDFDLGEDSLKALAQLQDKGMNNILFSHELAKKNLKQWEEVVDDVVGPAGLSGLLPDELREVIGVTKAYSPSPLKGMITRDGRKWRPEAYSRMVMNTDASLSYNMGVIQAAHERDLKYVRVVDGTGCGWTSHRDPEQAHGKIVTLDDAMAHPLAHPYCQRTFVVDDETKGRKRAGKARKAIRVATALGAATAATGAAGFVALRYSPSLQRSLTRFLEAANPKFASYRQQMLKEALQERTVVDIADHWAYEPRTAASQVPDFIARDLVDRKVVGDSFSDFTGGFMNSRYAADGGWDLMNAENAFSNYTLEATLGPINTGNIKYNIPDIVSSKKLFGLEKVVSKGAAYINVSDRVTGSMSRLVGEKLRFGAIVNRAGDISRYGSLRVGQLARYRISHIQAGVANRLILNPNGMLRAGFLLDPDTGFVQPSLRFLPKGPLRINTTLRRSKGRYFTGDPIVEELEKILTRRGHDAVGAIDSYTEDYVARAMKAGSEYNYLSGEGVSVEATRPLLKAADFLPGTVDDIIYDTSNTIIRRGRIKNALRYSDGQGNTYIKDLLIKDGKFVTHVYREKGLVTSANTEINLLIGPNSRLTFRSRLDLTDLGIHSFTDISHLKLPDIIDFTKDIRSKMRVTGVSAQLTAFGYTPMEMTKVLRYRWEDGVMLSENIRKEALRRVRDSAIQQEFFYEMLYDAKSDIAKAIYNDLPAAVKAKAAVLAGEASTLADQTLYAFTLIVDARRHIYEAIKTELPIFVVKRVNKILLTLDSQYNRMVREVDQFLKSSSQIMKTILSEATVSNVMERSRQLGSAVRRDISRFLDLDQADIVKLSDHVDPNRTLRAAIPNLPIGDMVAHDLGQIISLTYEEISKILNIGLEKAKEIWNKALDGLSAIIAERWPSFSRYLEEYTGGRIAAPYKKVPTAESPQFVKVGDQPFAIEGARDFEQVIPWLEERFPYMKDRVGVNIKNLGLNKQGVFMSVKPRTLTIDINTAWALRWTVAQGKMARAVESGWFANYERSMRSMITHEFGHVVHHQTAEINNAINIKFMEFLTRLQRIDSTGNKIPLFSAEVLVDGKLADVPKAVAQLGPSNPRFLTTDGDLVGIAYLFDSWLSDPHNNRILKGLIGEYAVTLWDELVAETFALGLLGQEDSKIAAGLLSVIDEVLKDAP